MSFFTKPKEHYREHAKRGCEGCEGTGIIQYYVDQDWTVCAPCSVCFPEDRGAKKAVEWWNKGEETTRLLHSSL